MLKKEIKGILKSPVYFIIAVLPLLLTFIMSEGTGNYLAQHSQSAAVVRATKEIALYDGASLSSRMQFAVSELNFMLMMCAVLAGLSLFEERKLHVWDRAVRKGEFVLIKFFTHYAFSLAMIALNVVGFWALFDIRFPLYSLCVFFSVPMISVILGLFAGAVVRNRAMLSNSVLMAVMMMGYFGGALSLTSVLENTPFMNLFMYLSPLTWANKLIFKALLGVEWGKDLFIWMAVVLLFAGTFGFLIGKRVKHGAGI